MRDSERMGGYLDHQPTRADILDFTCHHIRVEAEELAGMNISLTKEQEDDLSTAAAELNAILRRLS